MDLFLIEKLDIAEQYAKKALGLEVQEISRTDRRSVLNVLSKYEKAIIYKYSVDGYIEENEVLRSSDGKLISEFGLALQQSLSKLPNYSIEVVYRCVNLTAFELQRYIEAFNNNKPIVEHAFVSTSKSESIADSFDAPIKFIILSKTGKEIEEIAKYGKFSTPNEQEVLFMAGTSFQILDIQTDGKRTLITMEEL